MTKKFVMGVLLSMVLGLSSLFTSCTVINNAKSSLHIETIATVESAYWVGQAFGPTGLQVTLKPTSSAKAGTSYIVDLYESGRFRDSKNVSWTDSDLLTFANKELVFSSVTENETDSYLLAGKNLMDVYTVKVHEISAPTTAKTTQTAANNYGPTITVTYPSMQTTSSVKTFSTPPPMTIDVNKTYIATIKTNYGDIVLQLYPKNAPLTVNNFVFLARQGFYNGIQFYRVIKGFMIQSGDPTGTGMGGPGYQFADELPTSLDYNIGTIAMANSGPNTNGSLFFIMMGDYTNKLPKAYPIFGKVTSGQDVVNAIGNVPVKLSASGENSTPSVNVHIITVNIAEN